MNPVSPFGVDDSIETVGVSGTLGGVDVLKGGVPQIQRQGAGVGVGVVFGRRCGTIVDAVDIFIVDIGIVNAVVIGFVVVFESK